MVDFPAVLVHLPKLTLFLVPGFIKLTPVNLLALLADDWSSFDSRDFAMVEANATGVHRNLKLVFCVWIE